MSKRVFVATDNRLIFEEYQTIFAAHDITPDFYCSPKSEGLFAKEIEQESIKALSIKTDSSDFPDRYDLGFSCHSKQIFPPALVNNILCINIHPGYNPYNRGWFPQVFSILNKKPAGLTIHVMDEEIDHGDIIAQDTIDITAYDTSLSAYDKIIAAETQMFRKVLPSILDGSFSRTAPDNAKGNYNGIKDYKALLEIDMDKQVTMREAIDFLRAMTHPPYKNAYFYDANGNKIMVGIELERAGEE